MDNNIESKITNMLNDPAAMEKVMAIAKSLGSGAGPAEAHGDDRGKRDLPAVIDGVAPAGDAGSLIRMISSMDPKVLNGMSRIIGEYSRPDDDRTRLLHALKPYLREERRGKMDQAVRIVKLAHTAKVAMETFR